MITYLYWGLIFAVVVAVIALGAKLKYPGLAAAIAGVVLVVGWAAYYFSLEQVFVKRWGGVMSISVPRGYYHIATTWKEDNLWVENYNPATNECVFSEYSKGSLLEGKVTLKNCNPVHLLAGAEPGEARAESAPAAAPTAAHSAPAP